jgi:hypothetical protein
VVGEQIEHVLGASRTSLFSYCGSSRSSVRSSVRAHLQRAVFGDPLLVAADDEVDVVALSRSSTHISELRLPLKHKSIAGLDVLRYLLGAFIRSG